MRGTIPKFSARNLVNVTLCQHYPDALEGLTLSEEYLIAKCHPVGVVVKLRPGGRSSPVNYYALRGHFIVIPQDPGPLLQILPSTELRLHTLIKVFWLGNRSPTDTDLNPFLLVRKQRVLAALHYLVCHNQVYSGVTINHSMMDEWADDFIPTELRDSIVRVDDTDHHEREGYTVNLQEGNYENDFQAAEADPSEPGAGALLMTGSVTTDINGERQNPDLRILDTLMDLVENRSQVTNISDHRRTPLIRYTIRGAATLVNHWDDPLFFHSCLPNPISDRFARHKTFMYLLYDVIQLRGASLGNSLLVIRHHWRSVSRDIECLTVVKLKNAAEALAAGRNVEDPTIKRLLRHIAIIGVRVPGSFSQKMLLRSQARGLTVREGMLAIWLTLNPSDLQNPLVLILAGIEYDSAVFPAAAAAVRQAVVTSNPVAVAQFFHHTCKGILDGLLRSESGGIGIFGDVSNYFGVVETNGRGMLHLHTLVWVRGNLRFTTMREQVLSDSGFAARMIRYLETIIVQSVDESKPDNHEGCSLNIPSSASGAQSDQQFLQASADDANFVARKKQIHSRHHSATCFKYRLRGTAKNACRFGMPRDLVSESKVDDLGMIHLRRNHAWVTAWNPAIASCNRSNHDISWVPTVSKSLSLLYYITNYATKDDVSPLQIVLKASLLKQSIDYAKSTESPTATDLRLREKGMDSFALRCFNALSHDREISGVQVASTLLQLPSYYTDGPDSMAEEPCTYDNDTAPASIFDNYKWRGPHLASLTLFEYGMLVRTKSLGDSIATDFDFDAMHPRYGTHVQRIARTRSQIATVTFVGQLTEFQTAEDSVPGGNPTTTAIANDIAEVLLGLFVPWQQLAPHFQHCAAAAAAKRDACAQVWATVEPMLAPHIQNFAKNVGLLRKSKEDCRADAELWKRSGRASDSFDRDMDDLDPTDLATDNDEPFQNADEAFNANTLLAAFHSLYKS
ncbi:hypothetical protein DTO027I6_10052 [Penicillium roqueforti]|nr:hypothetical protein CBS147337_10164 [Penicillium roqueforti]KAI3184027.1 hypothetical protein DTO027I6_10052 [Penicillium roqueforti]